MAPKLHQSQAAVISETLETSIYQKTHNEWVL